MFGFAHGGCIKSTAGFVRQTLSVTLFRSVGRFVMHFKSRMGTLLTWQLPGEMSQSNRKIFKLMRRDYTITYGVMAVSRWLRPGEFAPAWQTKVLVNERVISLRAITIRALPRRCDCTVS